MLNEKFKDININKFVRINLYANNCGSVCLWILQSIIFQRYHYLFKFLIHDSEARVYIIMAIFNHLI